MRKHGMKIGASLLTMSMLLTGMVSGNAYAETSGSCGENASWTYDEDTKTLTVSGTGAIDDYYEDIVLFPCGPWGKYDDSGFSIRDELEKVVTGQLKHRTVYT